MNYLKLILNIKRNFILKNNKKKKLTTINLLFGSIPDYLNFFNKNNIKNHKKIKLLI